MAEVDTTAYEAQIDADKRLNKSEKKARKALAKLGLKPVPGVSRVTMKKPPSILFYIGSPEVFKAPAAGGQETYVVYGQCQIDDGQGRGRMAPRAFPPMPTPAAGEGEDDDMPSMVPSDSAADGAEGDVDAGDLQEKDIEMVMTQAGVDRSKAITTLKKNNGDIINSIMDLTM